MRARVLMTGVVMTALAGSLLAAADSLLTMEEIRKLVDAGQYKDAQKPIFRALALQGAPAAGYDRVELFMLRAECQIQTKDSQGAIASAEQAKKEALAQRRFDEMAAPTALVFLLQKSPNLKFTPKKGDAIPVQDLTLRPAAYAALLAEELPGAKQKAEELINAKTIGPVLEAAKAVGKVRALDVVTHREAKTLQTSALATLVTSNADRLFTAAIDDMNKKTAAISTNANQIVRDTVAMYDPITKQSWQQPRTRRRGLTNGEAQTLRGTMGSCEKIHASCSELAGAMFADFEAYQAMVTKAEAAKAKAGAVLGDDYLQVPQ